MEKVAEENNLGWRVVVETILPNSHLISEMKMNIGVSKIYS